MRPLVLFSLLAMFSACNGDPDEDGDGSPASADCNDADAGVFPGATEVCDGVDQDCDGTADNGVLVTFYADQDADGFGDNNTPELACAATDGLVADNTDCDDTNKDISPDAAETCNETDDDCDDDIDEDAEDALTWYRDEDGDTFGDAVDTIDACEVPTGYVADKTDCDDTDFDRKPGVDWYPDADQDGYGDLTAPPQDCLPNAESDVADGTDCNDKDAAVNPGEDEVCNGVNDDCDAETDEADAVDARPWYRDADMDTFGDPAEMVSACAQPAGYAAPNTDCDDTDAGENPLVIWFADVDGDTFGDGSSRTVCERSARTDVLDSTDCDDKDAEVYPGADEIWYDDIDQACDGGSDWDQDGDGYDSTGLEGGTDCDDEDAKANPAATEVRDGDDDDCDGKCDEGFILPGDLIISEILFNGLGSTEGSLEWFEVYNPNAYDIPLCDGWVLKDGTGSVTVTGNPTIASGDYFVFGADDDTSKNGGVTVDFEYGTKLPLGNSGDTIDVTFDGTTIDKVVYATSGDWSGKSSDGKSIQVVPAKLNATDNDLAGSWCVSATAFGVGTSFGTPGAKSDCP
jgi:hypothetical protein